MNKADVQIYKAMLTSLKNGTAFNKNCIAKLANISRQTIDNKIEKHTFQNLEKK
ncbi:MAG: hypothetical protein WC656_03245 [Sulfurimonas sp.]|jgi:hypothetical protein